MRAAPDPRAALDRAAVLLRARGKATVTGDGKLTSGGTRHANVDVTVWRIDRRPNRPRTFEQRVVPTPGGFTLEVQSVGMLPQIMTQYAMPPGNPTSRLAPMATYALVDDHGKPILTSHWYAGPGAWEPKEPQLIVHIEAAPDVPADLLDAAAAAALSR